MKHSLRHSLFGTLGISSQIAHFVKFFPFYLSCVSSLRRNCCYKQNLQRRCHSLAVERTSRLHISQSCARNNLSTQFSTWGCPGVLLKSNENSHDCRVPCRCHSLRFTTTYAKRLQMRPYFEPAASPAHLFKVKRVRKKKFFATSSLMKRDTRLGVRWRYNLRVPFNGFKCQESLSSINQFINSRSELVKVSSVPMIGCLDHTKSHADLSFAYYRTMPGLEEIVVSNNVSWTQVLLRACLSLNAY